MRFAKFSGVLYSVLPLAGLLLLGCGPDFDPPSELHSLRVLGVQKDEPYAEKGSTVNLRMLWEDASLASLSGQKRDIEIVWSGPCFDPKGGLYYSCFTDPSLFGKLALGDQTSFEMDAAIQAQPPPNAAYGIAYVFFAACAGKLVPIPQSTDTSFPVGCQDASGNLLGSDDFVAGYTSVYSFPSFHNDNPFLSGFQVQEQAVTPTGFCTDHGSTDTDKPTGKDNCQARAGSSAPADIDCDEHPELCIAACAADGDKSCPAIAIKPTIDKTNALNHNQDDVSKQLLGRDVGEQMWIDYYTDAGSFKSPVRLLNDATSGWNDDYGTEFYAPKTPGLARIWALAHDNRGGVGWAGVTIKVQ